jgi:hypothetical protein
MGERFMKHLRPATNQFDNAPPRTGLKIISLIVGVMYSLVATAQVQFTEVSVQAGISGDAYVSRTVHGLGVNWVDFDNDGWPDIFTVNGFNGDGSHLYRNERNGTFSNQDILLPAMPNDEQMGSVFADYDNDGDSDIYIFTDNQAGPVGPFAGPVNILLKNQWVENGNQVIPGQPLFVDVAAAAGVDDLLDTPHADGPAYRASTGGWFDYDRDGHVDLYVCHWDRGKHGEDQAKDRLYRNLGNGTFEDVTTTTGLIPVDDGTYARSCLAFIGAHLDSDMWPDIYIGNVDAPMPFSRDYIFQNNAGTGFTERTLDSPGVGDDADAAMGVTIGDLDLNGGWDVYLSDLGGGVVPQGNPLYLHTGADILYLDNSADVAGAAGEGSWGVNFFDVDHDGYEDLYVASMGDNANLLYLNNQGDGTFTKHPPGVGAIMSRGSAYADFDRDGDLDIAVVEINGSLHLYRNDSTNSGHWLQIQLVASDNQSSLWSNRDAINTLVKVTANGQTYMRQVIGGDSGHGQNSLDLHFGLGAATTISQIEVLWPSGATEILTDQAVDTFMVISEAGGGPGTPAINSPIPGSTLASGDATFSWTDNGATVDDWQLLVGTSMGDNSLFDSGVLPSTTTTTVVSGLPEDGSTLHATLRWTDGGGTSEVNYTYTASSGPGGGGVPMMVSPLNGSTLSGASETFTWSADGADVDKWRLEIGTVVDGRDIYGKSLDTTVTSQLISDLPTDGSTVYVTLKWKMAGVVSSASYVYTSAGGTPGTPAITSPVPGSTLPAGDVNFTWADNGSAVDDWQLLAGTSVGDSSLYDSGVLLVTTTSVDVSGLPEDGSTVHVTLLWNEGGIPTEVNYTYTASSGPGGGVPMMLSPLDGSTLAGASETFTWSAEGAAIDRWRLEVGTSPDSRDLFATSLDSTVTSTVVSGLPTDGSLVYVNLKWRIDGVVSAISYVYTASGDGGPPPGGTPLMTSPADGATLAGSSETFTWSAEGAAVDKWRLEIGTTAGSRDLFSTSLDATVTSTVVSVLPADGSTVYVNLKWRIDGVVSAASYVYTASGP